MKWAIPFLCLLCGCSAGLSQFAVIDGIRGGDACGEAGLATCRTRAGTLDGSDLLVPIPGALSRTSFADGYLFRALESGPMRIGMASSQVDSLIQVWRVLPDETMELLDEDDDAGFGMNAVTRFTAEADAEYLVVATSWGKDFGRYRIIYSESLNLFDSSLRTIAPLIEATTRHTR